MKLLGTTFLCGALWLALITTMHGSLNLKWFAPKVASTTKDGGKFRIGFLPVTCHLTCPVTDFINQQVEGQSTFDPVRFSGWPELKEAFLSGYTPATFILAPMAMALREQGGVLGPRAEVRRDERPAGAQEVMQQRPPHRRAALRAGGRRSPSK